MSEVLDYVEKWWGLSKADIEKEQIGRPNEMLELLIESQEIKDARHVPWEYKSLAAMAKEDVVTGYVDAPMSTRNDVHALIHAVADTYGMHLRSFRYYVPEGLRLYVRDGNSFREGNDNDPDWHYFRLMAERDDSSLVLFESPSWAKNLFVKYENYRLWRAIYCDIPNTSHPDYFFVKSTKRRAVDALMDDAGVTTPIKRNDSFPHDLCAAIEAFEAVSGDPSTIAGKSPKAAITAWLKVNKPELSRNARERIATVANWQQVGGAPKTPGD